MQATQRMRRAALLATVAALASGVCADFSLDWFVVSGGGGSSTDPDLVFDLSGTIGQPDAGAAMSGGGFELSGGYWVVVVVAPAVCPGDCNCDGNVGFADIDYFVAAIPNNETAWRAKFPPPGPTCTFANCDVDGDGNVGFADIDPFVALIPSACP